jgi:hypothetical protein
MMKKNGFGRTFRRDDCGRDGGSARWSFPQGRTLLIKRLIGASVFALRESQFGKRKSQQKELKSATTVRENVK